MKNVSINFVFLFVVVCSVTLCQCCSNAPCSEKDHVEKNPHSPQQPQQQSFGQMSAQQMQSGGSSTSTAAPALFTTYRPEQAHTEFSNKRPDLIIQSVDLNEMSDHPNKRGDQRRKRHIHLDLFEHGHGHHFPHYDHHHHDYDYHHHHHHH